MTERQFPIMHWQARDSVPWSVVEQGRDQAMKNHGQTLERLAARGGLDIIELAWILTGTGWRGSDLSVFEAEKIVYKYLEQPGA